MVKNKMEQLFQLYSAYYEYISSRIIGQEEIIEKMFIALMVEGNILLEGPPGVGKTSLVKTFSHYLSLQYARIQFTPDLMPLDIIGSNIIQQMQGGEKKFEFFKGPLFTNIVLGDEINRATPKTQSAFLEAMEEKKITFLGVEYPLPRPYMVVATQNPIELEGTYPLPEAQVDRFFMKLFFEYPDFKILKNIMERNEFPDQDEATDKKAANIADKYHDLAGLEKDVVVLPDIQNYITKLVVETHPEYTELPMIRKYVLYGASPRAAIAILRAVKWKALLEDRLNVSFGDVKEVAFDILNHRIILNFDGEAENISKKRIIKDLLKAMDMFFKV
ncbi:MAG: MoxR family ATPase [Spirochaetes bacterium]|nr:MoxR family ATPase [Spirochaetota bacterium]